MQGISSAQRWMGLNTGKYSMTMGFMALVITSTAASSWTAAWILVGSGVAAVTVLVIVWQTGSRQARVALASRTGVLCNPSPAEEIPVHFSVPATGLSLLQDTIGQDMQDHPRVQQFDSGMRRAAVSRFASRRLLARRPIPGPRRHYLKRWGNR